MNVYAAYVRMSTDSFRTDALVRQNPAAQNDCSNRQQEQLLLLKKAVNTKQ